MSRIFRLVFAGAGTCLLSAQGTIDAIRTGNPAGLSILRSGIIVTEQSPQISFQFGFGTEEEIVPELFLDSITGSLQSADSLEAVVVLFTVDRSGASWAPDSPGAISFDQSNIQRRPIGFPSVDPRLAHENSYEVVVNVPSALRNQPLNFHFDLFDNENPLRSIAWLGEVTVVPEPAIVALSLAGLWIFGRREKR